MKILILGHYEIASNYAISLVVNQLLKHDLSIMLSGKGDSFESEGNGFSRLAHYEQQLCDELNKGVNSLQLDCDSFDVLEQKTGNPIEILSKPNSKNGINKVHHLNPELIISIRYRKILKEKIISIPEKGIINLHSGLLPQYRGAMATFWAMLKRDENIGSTLHYISDGTIDTGAVITRSEIESDYHASYLQNVLNLYPSGCENIVDAVTEIVNTGKAKASDQREEGAYYSFPVETDLELFVAKNLTLF